MAKAHIIFGSGILSELLVTVLVLGRLPASSLLAVGQVFHTAVAGAPSSIPFLCGNVVGHVARPL
jgi:hypothetical protein